MGATRPPPVHVLVRLRSVAGGRPPARVAELDAEPGAGRLDARMDQPQLWRRVLARVGGPVDVRPGRPHLGGRADLVARFAVRLVAGVGEGAAPGHPEPPAGPLAVAGLALGPVGGPGEFVTADLERADAHRSTGVQGRGHHERRWCGNGDPAPLAARGGVAGDPHLLVADAELVDGGNTLALADPVLGVLAVLDEIDARVVGVVALLLGDLAPEGAQHRGIIGHGELSGSCARLSCLR